MKMMVFDHEMLMELNESSVRAGRNQNLRPDQLPPEPQDRYWINAHLDRERDGQPEIRLCIVMNLSTSRTVWLDVSPEEFVAIPEVEVPLGEWETAMCAGTPRRVP
jgi:hypothetical protein